jgi:hypothetical protein
MQKRDRNPQVTGGRNKVKPNHFRRIRRQNKGNYHKLKQNQLVIFNDNNQMRTNVLFFINGLILV